MMLWSTGLSHPNIHRLKPKLQRCLVVFGGDWAMKMNGSVSLKMRLREVAPSATGGPGEKVPSMNQEMGPHQAAGFHLRVPRLRGCEK